MAGKALPCASRSTGGATLARIDGQNCGVEGRASRTTTAGVTRCTAGIVRHNRHAGHKEKAGLCISPDRHATCSLPRRVLQASFAISLAIFVGYFGSGSRPAGGLQAGRRLHSNSTLHTLHALHVTEFNLHPRTRKRKYEDDYPNIVWKELLLIPRHKSVNLVSLGTNDGERISRKQWPRAKLYKRPRARD